MTKKLGVIKSIIIGILLLTPIIDVLNGIFSSNNSGLSIGQLLRALILVLSLLITLMLTSGKKMWKIINLISIIFFSLNLYIHNLSTEFYIFMTDVSFLLKVYMFISLFCLIATCVDINLLQIKDLNKVIKFSILFIPISIFLSSFMGKSFSSYNDIQAGNRGMFIATNTINIVLIILFIFSIYLYLMKELKFINIIIVFVTMLLIGTKSSIFFAIFIIMSIIFFSSKHKLKTLAYVLGISSIILIIVTILFREQINNIISRQIYLLNNALYEKNLIGYFLTGRELYLREGFRVFWENFNIINIVFGFGTYNMQIAIGNFWSLGMLKAIEMDLFDIFFYYGLVGVFLTYGLFIYIFNLKIKHSKSRLYINLTLICILIFSFLGGHTFTEAMSATYVSIILGYKYLLSKEEQKDECCNNSIM